ncbi:uncharacterized protein LOC135225267 [Macrobrachium nipponense]|uniref:uncharacterized protein LOC135225267 n=1 Tax=Macrobrachium nipponense TaxID=159736 RepID=UPI0030C85679
MLQVESEESSPVIDSVNDSVEADESREWAEQDGLSVAENTVVEVESIIEEIFLGSEDKDVMTGGSDLSQNVEESHNTRENGIDIEQQLKSLVEDMDVMSSSFVQEIVTIEKVEEKISMATESSMIRPESVTEFEDELIYVLGDETTPDADNLVNISPATIAKELEMTTSPKNAESLPEVHVESSRYFPSMEDIEITDIVTDVIVEPVEPSSVSPDEIPQELLLKPYGVNTDSNVQENNTIKDLELIESISEVTLVQELKTVSENITNVEIVQEVNLDEIKIVPEAAFGEGTGIMVGLLEEGIDVIVPTKGVKVQNIPETHEDIDFEQRALEIESVISVVVSDSATEDTSSNSCEESYALDAISEEVIIENMNIEAEAILPVVSEFSVEVLELVEAGVDQVPIAFETVVEEIVESTKDIELMVITPGTSVEKTVALTGILVDEAPVKEIVESPGDVFAEEIRESFEAVEEEDLTTKLESSCEEMVELAVAITDEVGVTVDSPVEENVEINRAISEELREEELSIKLTSPIEAQVEEIVESTEGITVDIMEPIETLVKEGEMANISKDFVDELAGGKMVIVKREAPVEEIADLGEANTEEVEVVPNASAKDYMESVGGVSETVITPNLQFEEIFESVEDDIGKFSIITETSTKENAESVSAFVQKEEVEIYSGIFGGVEFSEIAIEEVSEILESFVEEIVESTIDFIEETGIVPEVLVDELVDLTGSNVEEVGALYEEITEPSEYVIEVASTAEASIDDNVESTRDVVKEEVACVSEFSEEIEELEVVIDEVVESVQGNTEESEIIHEAFVDEAVESTSSVVKKEAGFKHGDPIEEISIPSEAVAEDVAIAIETPVEGTVKSTEVITENIYAATEAASVVEIEEFVIEPEPLVEEVADLAISESSAEEIVKVMGDAVMEISIDFETHHGGILDSMKDLAIEAEKSKEIESATAVVEKDVPVSFKLPEEIKVPSAVIEEVFDEEIPILSEASIDEPLKLNVAPILEEARTILLEVPGEEIVASTEEVTITVETSALEILKSPEPQVGEIVEFPQAVTEDIAVTTKASADEVVLVAQTSFEVIVEPTGAVVNELVEVELKVPIEIISEEVETSEEVMELTKSLIEDLEIAAEDSVDTYLESTDSALEDGESVIKSDVVVKEFVTPPETITEVVATTIESTAEEIVESAQVVFEEAAEPSETFSKKVAMGLGSSTEEILGGIEAFGEEEKGVTLETFVGEITASTESIIDEPVKSTAIFGQVEHFAFVSKIVGEDFVELTETVIDGFAVVLETFGEESVEPTSYGLEEFEITLEGFAHELLDSPSFVGGDLDRAIKPEAEVEETAESSAAVTKDFTITAEASEELLEFTQPVVEAEEAAIMEEAAIEEVDKPSEAVTEEVLIITNTSVEVLDELEIAGSSESINEEVTFTVETSAEVTMESTSSSVEVELDITSEIIDNELVEITDAIIDEIAVITEAFVEEIMASANAIGESEITTDALVQAFMESTVSAVEDEKNGDKLEAVVEESVEPSVMVIRDITVTTESFAEENLKSAGPVVEEEEFAVLMNAHVEEAIEPDETVSEDFTITVEVSAKETEESTAAVVEEASFSLNIQTEMVVEASENEAMTEISTEEIVEVETYANFESPEGILGEVELITEISAEEVVELTAKSFDEEFAITSGITDDEFFNFTEAIIDEVAVEVVELYEAVSDRGETSEMFVDEAEITADKKEAVILLDCCVEETTKLTRGITGDISFGIEAFAKNAVETHEIVDDEDEIITTGVYEENVELTESVIGEAVVTAETFVKDIVGSTEYVTQELQFTAEASINELMESADSVIEDGETAVKLETPVEEIDKPFEALIEKDSIITEMSAEEILKLTLPIVKGEGVAIKMEDSIEVSAVEVVESAGTVFKELSNTVEAPTEEIVELFGTAGEKVGFAVTYDGFVEERIETIDGSAEIFGFSTEMPAKETGSGVETKQMGLTSEIFGKAFVEGTGAIIDMFTEVFEEFVEPSENITEKVLIIPATSVGEHAEPTGNVSEEDEFVIKEEVSVEIAELFKTVTEEGTVETSETNLKELVGTSVEKVDDFITPESVVEVESTGGILEDLGSPSKAEEVVRLPVSVVEEKEVAITNDDFDEVIELAEAVVGEVPVIFEAIVGDMVESIEDIGIALEAFVSDFESVDSMEEDTVAILVDTNIQEIVKSKEVTITTEAAVQETEALPLSVIEEIEVAIGFKMENNIESKQETILEAGIESDVEEVAVILERALKIGDSAVSVAEETEILLDVGNVSDFIEEETKIIPGKLVGEIPLDDVKEMEVLGSVLEEGKLASPAVLGEDFESLESIVMIPEIILEESEIFPYAVKKEGEVLLEPLSVDEEITSDTDEEEFDGDIAKEVVREIKVAPEYSIQDSEIVDIVVKEVETTQTLLGDSEIALDVVKEIESPPEASLGDSDIVFAVVKEIGVTLKPELKEREIVLSAVEEVDSIFDDSDRLFDTAVQESVTPEIVLEAAATKEMEMIAEAVFIGSEVASEGMEVTQEYLWEDNESVPAMDDSMQMEPFSILDNVESAFTSIIEETEKTTGADMEDVNFAAVLEDRMTPVVFVEEERTIISVLEDEITQDVWEDNQITLNSVVDKIEKILDYFSSEIEIIPASVLEDSDCVLCADSEESELELAPDAILKDGEISVVLEEADITPKVVLEDFENLISKDFGDIEISPEAAIDAEIALSPVEETGVILEALVDSDEIAFDIEEEIEITPEALLEDEIASSVVEEVGEMKPKSRLEEEEYVIGVAEKIDMVSVPEIILSDDFVSDTLWQAIGVESILEIHDTESDDGEQIKITPEAILADEKNTAAAEETEVTPEAILEGGEIASDVVEEIRIVPERVVELGELAASIVFEKIDILPSSVLETAEDILYTFDGEIRITPQDLLEESDSAAEAILKDTVISYSAASGAVKIPVGTVTEKIDITEVVEVPIGTVTDETDKTPEAVLCVETVTEESDITTEIELPVGIVSEEIDVTPVADELPVVIVTEEIEITAEFVEIHIGTVTKDFDITPEATELRARTVTEETDITSESAELPIGTVPEDIDITTEAVEVLVGTASEEMAITSEVVEVLFGTVTEEIDITPEAADIPVGSIPEEIYLTPVTDELPVGTATEEIDLTSEVFEVPVGTAIEKRDTTPKAAELLVETVTEEIDITEVEVLVETVANEIDITPGVC